MKRLSKLLLARALGVLATVPFALAEANAETVEELWEAGKIQAPGAAATWVTEGADKHLVLTYSDTDSTGSLKLSGAANARYLLVGGGGSGGSGRSSGGTLTLKGCGGGGGGGGVVELESYKMLSAGTYTVKVGAGGAQTVAGELNPGNNGGDSYLRLSSTDVARAYGGGGGGAECDGNRGGSGGGGSISNEKVAGAGGAARAGSGGTAYGNAGGAGSYSQAGAGGGGAGGAGADVATAGVGGAGGAGYTSTLTGANKTYAGGGGGGVRVATKTPGAGGAGGGGSGAAAGTVAPGNGTDGLGGGGGGGSLVAAGGKGGSGVVVIRISQALGGDLKDPTLTPISFAWDGQEHVAMEESFAYTFSNEGHASNYAVKATDVGEYVFWVTPVEGVYWDSATKDRSTKKVTWSIKAMEIEKPVAPESVVYEEGVMRFGLVDPEGYAGKAYTVTGVTNAVDAGIWSYTCTPTGPFAWVGGSKAPITVNWEIERQPVTPPENGASLVYTGKVQTPVDDPLAAKAYVVGGTFEATSVGNYSYTATPTANYCWAYGGESTSTRTVTWSITQAANEIWNLRVSGWKAGSTASKPSFSCYFPTDITDYTQYCKFSTSASGPWLDWRKYATSATAPGNYYVKATISATRDYAGAEAISTFMVWDDPTHIFDDSVEIRIIGYKRAEAIAGMPVLVRISAERMAGFDYLRAVTNEMAFVDATGAALPYEVDTWVPGGESLVWVRTQGLTGDQAKITMYWALKEGQSSPGYTPEEVWRDFTGVWHLNEDYELGEEAAYDSSRDSTGSGHNAAPYTGKAEKSNLAEMCSTAGRIGNGRVIETRSVTGGNSLRVAGLSDVAFNGVYTFSGWVRVDNYGSGDAPRIVSRTDGSTYGFDVFLNASNRKQLSLQGGAATTRSTTVADQEFANLGWCYVAVSVNGTSAHVGCLSPLNAKDKYLTPITGTIVKSKDNGLPICFGAGPGGNVTSLMGALDELRLSPTARSDAWLYTEYDMVSDVHFCTNSLVSVAGTIQNFWLREPSLSKISWETTDSPATVDMGQAATGKVSVVYSDRYTGEVFAEMPKDKTGVYRATFVVDAGEGVSRLEYTVDFQILGHLPYTDLRGGVAADQSSSGRILLMNRDLMSDHEVENQGWYDSIGIGIKATKTKTIEQVLADYPSCWTNVSGEVSTDDYTDTVYNRKYGTEWVYFIPKTGRELWWLHDCRHGNLFPCNNDTAALDTSMNYLPWSSTSKRITAHNTLPIRRRDVGQLLLRNVLDARVESNWLTNGVGTIYFDVVNAWWNSGDLTNTAYTLVVETCTNYVEDAWTEPVWQAQPMMPILISGSTATAQAEVTRFAPNVRTGGSTERFYRVVVPLDIRTPARIRIRRVEYDKRYQPDGNAYLALDNLIVSYPRQWAELKPMGWYDPTKVAKRVLGQENEWSVPFLARGEQNVIARAQPEYYVNCSTNVSTSSFITAAKLCYRWRYLKQKGASESDPWSTVDLNPMDNFTATTPLEIPDRCGDLEFWYFLTLRMPYYSYVDYSGNSAGLPRDIYCEELLVNTNRSEGVSYPSMGNDWFVRLREGRSDYEQVDLVVRATDQWGETKTERIAMELSDTHTWRGFYKTLAPLAGGADYRFELLNRQEPGSVGFVVNTNRMVANLAAVTELPASLGLVPGSADNWANVVCDAETGYLMFQIDDTAKSLTIAHADYQNFNTWHDANTADQTFVGTTTEDSGKSGTSPQMKEYVEDFGTWTDTPSGNQYWNEPFAVPAGWKIDRGWGGYAGYQQFVECQTPNGWTANMGLWAAGRYRDDAEGMALQMQGRSQGSIQFVDAANTPRGLERIRFNARLGQFIEFDDFVFAESEVPSTIANYTFFVRAAFDLNKNENFSGNASLSLVARYRAKKGCYEMRWEQLKETDVCKSSGLPGPYGQRLSLYKWSANSSGQLSAKLLVAVTNAQIQAVLPTGGYDGWSNWQPVGRYGWTQGIGGKFMPFYIAVTNVGDTVVIQGGINNNFETASTDVQKAASWWNWATFTYRDGDNPLKDGTYGFVSANCDGYFVSPHLIAGMPAITCPQVPSKKWTFPSQRGGWQYDYGWNVLLNNPRSCVDDIKNGRWAIGNSRMEMFQMNAVWGVRAKPGDQKIKVYTAPAGKTNWKLLTEVAVTDFGTIKATGTQYDIPLYTTDDCSVKFTTSGGVDDYRADVVIDDIELFQWRGDNYGSPDTQSYASVDDGYGWRTNFIFTSGWVTNHTVRLSAKRTAIGVPSSVRGPLLDGLGSGARKRGVGLGMVSFEYRNAQPNVRLFVQVATNNVTGTCKNINLSDDTNVWTVVRVIDFKYASPEELAGGLKTAYLGLHNVQGVIRIALDPKLVEEVVDETDPARFGEIDIVKIAVRDEPPLDVTCWWGWNLRSMSCGQDWGYGFDDGSKSFLSDYALTAGDAGLSLGLNNSVKENCRAAEAELYYQHMPFVQTPTFTNSVVGEVSFRARKFDLSESTQRAEVRLYGASSGDLEDDASWSELAHYVVSNTTYTSFRFRSAGATYRAFRLGVSGIKEIPDPASRGAWPTEGALPVRVMLDEIIVCEAVRPTMGFEYCYPFRDNIDGNQACTNIFTCDAQPLIGEPWTVQAKILPKQLPDEIDLTTPGREPRVYFHWFVGTRPWGYSNWASDPAAHSAELVRADGEQMIFRGGFQKATAAVVDAIEDQDFAVVQYSAEVVYWSTSGEMQTSILSNSEWEKPKWYDPLDYNNWEYRSAKSFSAYNILEKIAPNRVWFNEVNVFDGRTASYTYPADNNQYVEIAAPMQQPITNWRLDYINNAGETNTLCVFGETVADSKKENPTNEYVFITVHSPNTIAAGTWAKTPGAIDGGWNNFDRIGGMFDQTHPVAIRLVRPSQIVEQEIGFEGTNSWAKSRYAARYSLTNFVNKLNAATRNGTYYAVGNEYPSTAKNATSLGVFQNIGAVSNDWNNTMVQSPGRVNGSQIVPFGYVLYPNGAMLIVYSYLAGDGHIRQTFGEKINSLEAALATTLKGGEGTNIVYEVDKYWEIKSVCTNGVPVPGMEGRTGRVVFAAGAGISNNIDVVAAAQVRRDLRNEYGITDDNPYRDAVMAWLAEGKDYFGNAFAGEDIQPAWYKRLNGTTVTNLTLTQRYWLDIDPTAKGWVLKAGIRSVGTIIYYEAAKSALKANGLGPSGDEPPTYHEYTERVAGDGNYTNIRITVEMVITNENTRAAHAPYILRGLKPGSTSVEQTQAGASAWTSITFKVTGDIQNGMPMRQRWVPLRWFTFQPDASKRNLSASFDLNNRSVIDIWDPFDEEGAGTTTGWSDYPGCKVWYRWSIDERLQPTTVERLTPRATYTD